MIQTGETPHNHIKRVEAMGIQQFVHVMRAERAMLKIGTANRATTAGRTPLKKASTHLLSLNCEKTMAMANMMMMLGITTPNEAQMPERMPPHLYPMWLAISTAKMPGVTCETA